MRHSGSLIKQSLLSGLHFQTFHLGLVHIKRRCGLANRHAITHSVCNAFQVCIGDCHPRPDRGAVALLVTRLKLLCVRTMKTAVLFKMHLEPCASSGR